MPSTNTPSTTSAIAPELAAAAAVAPTTRERQGSFGGSTRVKVLKPFNTANIKILLLENVNETAVNAMRAQGYQ
ncbi:hypothetical protein BGZ93_005590, partial [Podila epicladia]